MANYREDIVDIELETGNIFRSFLPHSIGAGNSYADRFGVRAYRNGDPVQLTGNCSGLFIRANGTTVPISVGVVSDNLAYVVLPPACYAIEGVFSLSINIDTAAENETVTLRIVDGVVSRTSTDVYIDPGTVMESIEELIAAMNVAAASIPPEYSALVSDVRELYNAINLGTSYYKVTSQGGWAYTSITPYISLKKGDKVDINVSFSSAPANSTYIYLKKGDTNITNYQCKELSTKQITYTATEDISNFNLVTNSQNFTGTISVTLTILNKQTQVEANRISVNTIGREKYGYYTLERLSPFVRGGYDYPNFNYNTYQISSRDVMTAPFPMYMRVKSGFHVKALTISGSTVTDSGWQTDSLYIPQGASFVMKIERVNPDTTETADIETFVDKVLVFRNEDGPWFDIKRYADSLKTGKSINFSTGAEQSANSYYFLYCFKNPSFHLVKLYSSVYDRSIAEIAFYSTEEISTDSYLGGANAGSWEQQHYVLAEVPAQCKLVCFVSRNILNDNSTHDIQIYADDSAKYTAENVLYKHDALSLFDDYRYVYHFNANRLGNSEIPLNSLMDIDMAHRLGFKAYEINARETATPGCYVCMHGNSGKIGTELVARDGTDITNVQINTVTRAQFEENYIYNTPSEQMRTRVTFLDEAIIRCRAYGMVPFISWPGYDGVDYIRKYAGNKFVLIIYDEYYIGRTAFKGAINLYKTLTDTVFNNIIKSIEKPFVASLTADDISDMTADQKLERIKLCHENNCFIGAAGVYQSESENLELFDLGVDFLASGWEVEDFNNGNVASVQSNGTFTGFNHTGSVSGGVLTLSNGGTIGISPDNQYIAKGIIKIRFSGTLSFNFGSYIYNETITSDGSKDVILTTAFFRQSPGFQATASGAVSIYDCAYDASAC